MTKQEMMGGPNQLVGLCTGQIRLRPFCLQDQKKARALSHPLSLFPECSPCPFRAFPPLPLSVIGHVNKGRRVRIFQASGSLSFKNIPMLSPSQRFRFNWLEEPQGVVFFTSSLDDFQVQLGLIAPSRPDINPSLLQHILTSSCEQLRCIRAISIPSFKESEGYLQRTGSTMPMQIPKSEDAQVPYIKWYMMGISPMHLFPYALNHLWITYNT